jgi:DnaB helicase-like protein
VLTRRRQIQCSSGVATWRDPDSNRGHHDFQSCGPPTEFARFAGRFGDLVVSGRDPCFAVLCGLLPDEKAHGGLRGPFRRAAVAGSHWPPGTPRSRGSSTRWGGARSPRPAPATRPPEVRLAGLRAPGRRGRCMTPPQAPPHDLEAERAILGAVLLSERAMYAFVFRDDLQAEHFYRERHQRIWRAMTGLCGAGEPVDARTVANPMARPRGSTGSSFSAAATSSWSAISSSAGSVSAAATTARTWRSPRRRWARSTDMSAARTCGSCSTTRSRSSRPVPSARSARGLRHYHGARP